jgi:hypothetical protein
LDRQKSKSRDPFPSAVDSPVRRHRCHGPGRDPPTRRPSIHRGIVSGK